MLRPQAFLTPRAILSRIAPREPVSTRHASTLQSGFMAFLAEGRRDTLPLLWCDQAVQAADPELHTQGSRVVVIGERDDAHTVKGVPVADGRLVDLGLHAGGIAAAHLLHARGEGHSLALA